MKTAQFIKEKLLNFFAKTTKDCVVVVCALQTNIDDVQIVIQSMKL